MKYFLLFLFLVANHILVFAQKGNTNEKALNKYLNSIRNNKAYLTAFFQQMPKGGDLHHHYSGSVYAETYFDFACEKDFYVNVNTLKLSKDLPAETQGWARLSSLKADGKLQDMKIRLVKIWSVKDYVFTDGPSDKHFFDTFGYFGLPSSVRYNDGLAELKARAKSENVQYIETMLTRVPVNSKIKGLSEYDGILRGMKNKQTTLRDTLEKIYKIALANGAEDSAAVYNNFVSQLHEGLQMDDSSFTIRYQAYVSRNSEPTSLFNQLIASFIAAKKSPYVVGVNIVSPENGDVSMQDYWLHMQMFNFCHEKYPDVKYSMHAGELCLGLVKPEELTWHINEAVKVAKANRIGHGVDMPYEQRSMNLLGYMSEKKVAVEINLISNEFILNVTHDKHPFLLYKNNNVPIVISTDDAGVLRTNLTEQYVVLANRYPEVTYSEIKSYVYNSINFSFIKEKAVKDKVKSLLDKEFLQFESQVVAFIKKTK